MILYRTLRLAVILILGSSFNTKPRDVVKTIKTPIGGFEENASNTLGMNTSLLNITAATKPIGQDTRKILELVEQANICQGIGLLLSGVGAGYSAFSGSYTSLRGIYDSISPLERVMEVATSGVRSMSEESFELSHLAGPIGGTVLGALSVPLNPISALSALGGFFLCLSIAKRIQCDRLCQED